LFVDNLGLYFCVLNVYVYQDIFLIKDVLSDVLTF